MVEVSATIRLRPTRIALLVRPNDLTSVRRFMRLSAALWGGVYNPIIPVFRAPPREWRPQHPERVKGLAIARGYIEFFEPDVYVTAEDGLLDDAGLSAFGKLSSFRPRVFPLAEVLRPQDHRDWSEPAVGLGINDALQKIYEAERRFQLREPRPALLIKPSRETALAEAMFGVYPQDKPSSYIRHAYQDVYQPVAMSATPEAWRATFIDAAVVPLRVTRHGLDAQRSWHNDLKFFVFDPSSTLDLIDLWNMRLEPDLMIPLPIEWAQELAEPVREMIRAEHRPVQGNPNGLMHDTTIEFSRSIAQDRHQRVWDWIRGDLPAGAMTIKPWRNQIWQRHTDDRIHRDSRLQVWADEERSTLTIRDGERRTVRYPSLSPSFAAEYGLAHLRWVNSVDISPPYNDDVASVFPFNTFDPRWPRLDYLAEEVTIGTEGWVFGQQYKDRTGTIQLLGSEDAVVGSLKQLGIEAKPSDAGRVARQVLQSLEGIWGTHLLADIETLDLLNSMAGGIRRRGTGDDQVEEVFDRRVRPLKDWTDLIARRRAGKRLPRIDLEDFTKRKIIRLGVETDCPHCQAKNWHSLSAVDYDVACERCLKTYPFPQAGLRNQNKNWSYRVIGPFSVPDYARGAYGALLAINVMSKFGPSRDDFSFSTGLDLAFDSIKVEADYIGWRAAEQNESSQPPPLVIGEAKSLGKGDLIKPGDIKKLRALAAKLPGAAIVVSVMRDHFTDSEKKLLLPFVRWSRRRSEIGEPTNLVVLLTGNELFFDMSLGTTWKDLGGRYAPYADYQHTRSVKALAESTQAIYLSLPTFDADITAYWKKRHAARERRKAIGLVHKDKGLNSGRQRTLRNR